MAENQFSEFSEKAITATAKFLELSVEKVKECSWEEEDEIAEELFKDIPFMQDCMELDISEEVFAIYGKKVLLTFLFEPGDEGIRTRMIFFFGKVKDLAKTDKFLDAINLPDDTGIIYGGYEGDDQNVEVSMEVSIASENADRLYEDISNVLDRFSENESSGELKKFLELFKDDDNKE